MKHWAHEHGKSLGASLIGALMVSSLANGVYDHFEGDHGAVEYCAK